MNLNLLNKREIYTFAVTGDEEKSGMWIVYMPLVGYATLVSLPVVEDLCYAIAGLEYGNKATVDEILSHLDDERKKVYLTSSNEDGLLNMMILPNNRCNFHCNYCYSAYGRSGAEISKDKLFKAIDYFFAPSRAEGQRLTVSVLGGGEPLLSWNLLKDALLHCYEKEEIRNSKIPVSVVTNGSIMSDDIMSFCKEHNISLSVSFDILEDIQNEQRGNYSLVLENINKAAEYGLDIALNTVVTDSNVNRMREMILSMKERMPIVRKVSFKLLISDTYFPDRRNRELYYRRFVDNFFEARKLAEQNGIYLTCPYWNAVISLADRYCPGKFVVTAEGNVSICHCVSSSMDKLYDKFIFGEVGDDGVFIDREKLESILGYNRNKFASCGSCPCSWHCAGGCYTDGCTMTADDKEAYCLSMRLFLEKYLLEKISAHDIG